MRKWYIAAVIVLCAASRILIAAEADFNFEELMESVEFNANELQSSIVFEDVDASIAYANELNSAFAKIEGFFAGWGYADDAVGYSKDYQQRAAVIIENLQAKNFESAYNEAVEFSKHCKACHDRYKPL
jgi:hypothetical protein